MPAVAIPFARTQASGHEERGGAPPLSENILVDAVGFMGVFPGSSTWSYFPTTIPDASPVIGMIDWKGKLIYVTEDRKVHAIISSGSSIELSTATLTTQLDGGERPVFAKSFDRIYIAGGGRISYWDGAAATMAQISDADAPSASHVVAVDSRLVAEFFDNSGDIAFTDAGTGNELTGWRGANIINAEARPDAVWALHENGKQLFAFGPESTQVYEPDPNLKFRTYPTDNIGLGARYSVVNLLEDRAFAWLSNTKKFVVGDGRGNTADIGTAIAKTIEDIARASIISDAVGWRIVTGDHRLIMWRLATAGRTFCYDMARKRWAEIGARNSSGDRINWPVRSVHYWQDKGITLVGLDSGEIQVLDDKASTIGGLNFIGECITGYEDHASAALKYCSELRLTAVRGTTDSDEPPVVKVGFRDKPGPWKDVNFSLGNLADTEVTPFKALAGKPYRGRQWRCIIPPGHKVGKVEEVFDPTEV